MTSMAGKRRWLLAALLVLVFVAAVDLPFRYVQLRIWNHLSWVDLCAMTVLAAPFLGARWALPHRTRAAGIAWWICTLLALDVLAFGVGILAPTGGHPSLEALVSYFLGIGKVVLVPAALASLAAGAWRGEHALTLLLGTCCLAVETVYTVVNSDAPLAWFALLCRAR